MGPSPTDYAWTLHGLEGEALEEAKHGCHQRGANRLLDVCFKNGAPGCPLLDVCSGAAAAKARRCRGELGSAGTAAAVKGSPRTSTLCCLLPPPHAGGIYIKLGQHIGMLVRVPAARRAGLSAGLGCLLARLGWGVRLPPSAAQAAGCRLQCSASLHHFAPPPSVPPLCPPPLQDHLLPSEYVHTMRDHMLDRCPVSTYEQVAGGVV